MGTATRKAQVREATRQRLIQQTHRQAAEGASEFTVAQVAAAVREAKQVLKGRANSHMKREQAPGNFHLGTRRNGETRPQRMAFRNDAR